MAGHKSMNKLPFHEQLRIQFKSFDPNNFLQVSGQILESTSKKH